MTYKTQTQQALFAPFVDEQVLAQAELENHIEAQAQAVAAAGITVVEISFYDHEIYALERLIAKITHDNDDFVTQRWLVMVNSVEIHRADTWLKCHDYITYHYKQGTLRGSSTYQNGQAFKDQTNGTISVSPNTEKPAHSVDAARLTQVGDNALPVQEAEVPATTTGNEVIAEIAAACDHFGFEILDDGIYHNNVRLGQVGCTNGKWWVVRASSTAQNQVPCDSAFDAVWSLSMVEVLPSVQAVSCEELLDLPFDELTALEWERLKKDSSRELIAA